MEPENKKAIILSDSGDGEAYLSLYSVCVGVRVCARARTRAC